MDMQRIDEPGPDWADLLADPANAAGVRRLLQDIFTLPPIPEPTKCTAYRDALDMFVCNWLAGTDVAAAQSRLWRHLQVCADCQAAATALAVWLVGELARQGLGSPVESGGPSCCSQAQTFAGRQTMLC